MFDRNAYQREYRKRTNNLHTKVYEKTVDGFLMRLYRNMKSRITGVQKAKHHLYEGKELLSKEEFYEWAKCSPMFWCLYHSYVEKGYPRKLSPSVDRKDSGRGYVLDNMEWVTMSVNSQRGSKAKHAHSLHS